MKFASCRRLDSFSANYQLTFLPVTTPSLQTIVTYSSLFNYDIWYSIRRLRAFAIRCKFCPQTCYGCSVRLGIMLITTIGIGPRFFFLYAGNVRYTNILFALSTVCSNRIVRSRVPNSVSLDKSNTFLSLLRLFLYVPFCA